MITEHTPGPWVITQNGKPSLAVRGDRFTACTITGADGHDIADLRWNGLNAQRGGANAQLLAAAPELLAVCEAIAGCPQAAPWLVRLPFGDGTVWDALQGLIERLTPCEK